MFLALNLRLKIALHSRGQALNMRPMRIQHRRRNSFIFGVDLSAALPEDLGEHGRLVIFINHGGGKVSQQLVPLSIPQSSTADSSEDQLFIQETGESDPFHVAVADYFPHFSQMPKEMSPSHPPTPRPRISFSSRF